MKQSQRVLAGRWVAIACCLAALVFLDVGSARSGILNSRHDFSSKTAIATRGTCSACHLAHGAPTSFPKHLLLWSRPLTEEWSYFKYDGDRNTPNYVPDTTVLCYDCHDDNATTISSAVDDDPLKNSWTVGDEPQDIAFGYEYALIPPYNTIPDDTLLQGGTRTGYYELINGDVAGGPTPMPSTTVPAAPMGGHYWKSDPSGTPDYRSGDKIPCRLCHDPHNVRTGTNEAFFLTETSFAGGSVVTLGNGLTASKLNDPNYTNRYGSRNGTGTGREMCVACHSYSNTGSPVSLGGVLLPKPPPTIIQHRNNNSTACTSCHHHNQIYTSCTECHGFPPLRTIAQAGGENFDKILRKDVENYSGGAGAHQRHRDALGGAILQCEICHGPNPGSAAWHNQGAGTIADGSKVNIMGLSSYWDPGGTRTTDYNGTSNSPPATPTTPDPYEFSKTGGGDQRCSGLACHGEPPDIVGALNWTDKMVNDTTGDPVGDGLSICKWCHDATPARIGTGPVAPNVLGADNGATGVWTTGGWGADVNGHGLAAGNYEKDLVGEATRTGVPAANKQCTVCHDARYTTNALPAANTPVKPHFVPANNNEKRFRDTINGVATIADSADNTCIACHQVAAGADSASDPSQLGGHGNLQGTNGYKRWETDLFTRRCRACHEPHGANWNGVVPNPRNLHMLGKWVDEDGDGQPDGGAMGNEAARVDSNAVNPDSIGTPPSVNIDTTDLPIITKSSSGDNSWDDGNNDGLVPPDSICVVCHVSLVNNHSQVGDSVAQGSGHLTVGSQCRLCHQHGDGQPNAFGPLSCFACHGVAPADTPPSGELAGQYWPSGAASKVPAFNYSNNQKGAHRKHIDAIGLQVFGEAATQLVKNPSDPSYSGPNPALTSFEKQVEVCWFCHYDPGGADSIPDPVPHFNDTNTDNSPGQPDLNPPRVDVLQSAVLVGHPSDGPKYFRKFTTGAGQHGANRTRFADDATGGAYSFVTDNCANLVCHNQSATPAAPSTGASPGWNTPPDWSAGITTNCDNTTCHAAPGTYTLAHNKHVGGGVGQKNYRCRECHGDNGANLQHGNGSVDMQAGTTPWFWNNPATVEGSFGGANGFYNKDKSTAGPLPTATAGDTGFAYKNGVYDASCNFIYCHGDDNGATQLPVADRGTDTSPQWGLPLTAACGTCHGVSSATPFGDLSHPKHAGAAAGQYAIRCQACHYGTTTDGTTIASQTLHVNTSVEVSFNTLGDPRVHVNSSYGGDAVMGSGYGACSATYCHSRGNDTVAPYNDVPLSVPLAALPAWGTAGPLLCSGCHGNPLAVTVDRSMPDYADGTPKANKHAIHNTVNSFACDVCHYPTMHMNGTIAEIASTTLHVNGSYDAGPNTSGAALYQFTWARPNCNAVVCHGGNGTITWATGAQPIPYACGVCHSSVAGVVTNTDVDDFAWAGATPTMSKISNAEYVADGASGGGHGDNTAPNQPNQPCSGCHDSTAGHDTTAGLSGANPFRLVDQDSGFTGVQYSCSYTGATPCHTGSSPILGPRTGLNISTMTTHTAAKMLVPGGYTAIRTWPGWSVNLSCANCHDPHGDGNRSMINRSVYDKAAFPLPGPMPAPPTEQLALSFTDDTTGVGAGSFAWGLPDASGICQECHEPLGPLSMVSFTDGNAATVSGANHPYSGANPGDCSSCHRHDRAFRPTGCTDCHGTPPDPGINGGAGADAPNVMPFYNVNGHGAKTFDPDGLGPLGTRAVDCSDCHNPSPTHLNGVFETYAFPGSSFGAPNANTSHLKSNYFGSTPTEKDWQVNFDNNCYKNTFCHKDPPDHGHRHELTHKDAVVRFGDHSTVANPKQSRAIPGYWYPWTIDDISTSAPPPTNHYAPCVACHDPHGADYSGYTNCADTPDGNHHMVRQNNCDMDKFCNSNCHRR